MKPPKPIVLQVDPVSGQPVFPLDTMEGDSASNIFDRIGKRVFESKSNTRADVVAICINEAGLDALCIDDRVSRQGISRADIANRELFGLPFKVLADRPRDNFPHHWRFYLEFKSR